MPAKRRPLRALPPGIVAPLMPEGTSEWARRAFAGMPERDRAILVWRLDHRTIAAIASELKLSTQTVRDGEREAAWALLAAAPGERRRALPTGALRERVRELLALAS